MKMVVYESIRKGRKKERAQKQNYSDKTMHAVRPEFYMNWYMVYMLFCFTEYHVRCRIEDNIYQVHMIPNLINDAFTSRSNVSKPTLYISLM